MVPFFTIWLKINNPELLKEILIEIMELSRKLFFKKNTLAGQKKRKEFIEKISNESIVFLDEKVKKVLED